jgi:hypothetical protein
MILFIICLINPLHPLTLFDEAKKFFGRPSGQSSDGGSYRSAG